MTPIQEYAAANADGSSTKFRKSAARHAVDLAVEAKQHGRFGARAAAVAATAMLTGHTIAEIAGASDGDCRQAGDGVPSSDEVNRHLTRLELQAKIRGKVAKSNVERQDRDDRRDERAALTRQRADLVAEYNRLAVKAGYAEVR